jgi:zinc/manganese transport system substrate-binding protein
VKPHKTRTEIDPHIWHDVTNAIIMAQNIRDGLIKAMPNQQATLSANAATYIAQLQTLDSDIQTQIARIPPPNANLSPATIHSAILRRAMDL